MSESTSVKSKVFKEDLSLATGGTNSDEQGTRLTSTGGSVTLTKIDASHIKFRSVAKSIDDLVDGGKDVEIKPSSISMDGTLTNANETVAGFVINDASGVYSGGHAIVPADLPNAIDASQIANGSVNNTEYQCLDGIRSNIQQQIDNSVSVSAASKAEQETATEANKFVAPATAQYHPSAAKAWAIFQADGTILDSYNISSITDNGTGDWTLNFIAAFSSTYYPAVGSVETANYFISFGTRAVGSLQVLCYNVGGASVDGTIMSVICFGELQ